MSDTNFPLNHPMAVKRWANGLMKQALTQTHAMQFMGKDSNALCQIKSDLSKDAGDRIRFGLRMQLVGDGVQGDATAEGQEEALEIYTDDLYIDQLRHAVRSTGKMSEQRVPFEVRDEARDGLADWWANRIDTWFFNQLCGNTAQTDTKFTGNQAALAPDADHIVYPGTTTSEAAISASTDQVMSLTLIDKAVEKAKLAANPLRPIQVGNGKYFVMFLHTNQVYDLRTNTNTGQWLDIQKAAMSGGKVGDSPIFTGALGVYNGVVLHENTRVAQVVASTRRAVLAGAQAMGCAFGKGYGKGNFTWVEELFDYKNKLGVLAGSISGMKKLQYNGSDFASIVIPTRAVNH